MAESPSPIGRYDRWGVIFLLAIIIGIILLPLLLFTPFLGLLSFSFLIFGGVGIIILRRKVSTLKRAYPEVYRAYNAEINRTVEPPYVKLRLKDYPHWLVVSVVVSVVVFFADLFVAYVFPFNKILELLLMLPAIPVLMYLRFYERKIRKQKISNKSRDRKSPSG